MVYQPEDELAKLALSIKRKTARLKSQIEALQLFSVKRDVFTEKPTARIRRLFEEEDSFEGKALVRSISVNYANEKLWFSPTVSSGDVCDVGDLPLRLVKKNLEDKCNNCKYKQFIEEYLQMLSIPSFMEKPKKQEPTK